MKAALSVGASCAGLPAGEHRIEVRMGWTPVRLAGAVVSETVLLVVLVLLVWPVRRQEN